VVLENIASVEHIVVAPSSQHRRVSRANPEILSNFADILNQGSCSVSVRTVVSSAGSHIENDRTDFDGHPS
jgi:hypothetical protein